MGEAEKLQRLGRVLHVSSSRSLIVKAENTPKIRARTVDQNLRPVGSVSDVFGPVSSPYVSVTPLLSEVETLVNQMLYTLSSKDELSFKGRKRHE